ncbi:sigma-70 family RNA polymerase sigma factor [Flavivirga abyssicola]|uniref:RNA polymerase sigma factor n=1 Tax=Flavivirga abyssicola TaxID=3063533 RepID=UPI0026E0C993|nr:sigma-70 family RNA polymerase sigma factor [Flavivirga sp. MEBiC07777]WVK12019.1 sigma-70 family RNA polymerase sigma factor [Flavivirga sp. MEBiC07777]
MNLKQSKHFWKKLKARDEKTFGDFFQLYYPLLYARVRKIVKEQEDCKEIVQETFILFWDKVTIISPEKHFIESYLWKILKSQIVKFYRESKKNKVHFEEYTQYENLPIENMAAEIDATELKNMIKNALQILPKRTKEVFLLSKLNKLTYREIAEELDISIKTVEYHISYAIKKIKFKKNK